MQHDPRKPPQWLLIFGIGMLVIAVWTWSLSDRNSENVPLAEYAHAERIDFTQALKQVRATPPAVSKLIFVKGPREFPDKVILDYDGKKHEVVADIPGEFDYNLIAAEAERQNIERLSLPMSGKDMRQEYVQGPTESGGTSAGGIIVMILNIAMVAIPFAILFFAWKNFQVMQGGGGAAGFAKSKHRKFEPDQGPKVTFADVAGVDEAIEDLKLVVEYLKDPSEIKDLGGKVPKGVLMIGPPGTGKTLLAKAVAGEANVPVYYINASEFVEMFVGVGAARVRDMFQQIRQSLPCILIVDELDAVAQHRGTGIGGGNDERQQTINQLLTEIDGFEDVSGLIAFGLTNRPDVLDPAILRSGRFGDMKVTVNLPDKQGRYDIIQVHARGVKLDPNIDMMEVAGAMSGFSGADIASVLKIHAPAASVKRHRRLFGIGKKADLITREDLDKGISHIQMGGSATESKSKRLSDAVKKLLAYHELGHALVGEYLFRMNAGWSALWGDQVRKITIIGANGAGGYTLMQGDEDPFCQTREQLLGMITGLLAANRAEKMFLGTTSTGASNDIERAYDIAKKMVTQLGMSKLGPICVGKGGGDPFLGRAMAQSGGYGLGPESSNQIDHEIFLILADCALRADRILRVVDNLMHIMAPELIKEETMLRARFVELWVAHTNIHALPEVSMSEMSEEALVQALPTLGLRAPEALKHLLK